MEIKGTPISHAAPEFLGQNIYITNTSEIQFGQRGFPCLADTHTPVAGSVVVVSRSVFWRKKGSEKPAEEFTSSSLYAHRSRAPESNKIRDPPTNLLAF